MSLPLIKILRPGTFTDIHGTEVSFGAAEIDQILSSYDPERDPAPLVAGHPKHDDPAQGWVNRLSVEGGVLFAEPGDVAPEFAELVRTKRYRRISASFYPPKHRGNPTPGKWHLKHVGFLGAQSPAVKGLGTVSFSEADDRASTTIDLSEETNMTDTTGQREIALGERETALSTRETEIAQREKAQADREAKERHESHVAFAEDLVEKVLLAPAGKGAVIALMDHLGEVTEVVSFGEGDAAEQKAPIDIFKGLFDGAQPIISLGESAATEKKAGGQKPSDLAQRASEFVESERKAGRTVTIQTAVRHVSRQAED